MDQNYLNKEQENCLNYYQREFQLSEKNRLTLNAIFKKDIDIILVWADLEELFLAVGANLSPQKTSGHSRIRITLNKQSSIWHFPLPRYKNRPINRMMLKDVKFFLMTAYQNKV